MACALRAILEIVCVEFSVSPRRVASFDEGPKLEAARRISMWLAYAFGHDLAAIGTALNRHPATVRDMIYRLDVALDRNPKIADLIIGLSSRIARARHDP